VSQIQTFMPYQNYQESAECLDRARLGKQRVEVFQIMQALAGEETRWVHHPAVRMWVGSEFELLCYGTLICREWVRRGYEDNMQLRMQELSEDALRRGVWTPARNGHRPWWMGYDRFHLSHRSNLIHKMPEHYGPLWPGTPVGLEYVWPPEFPIDEI